MTVRDTGGKGVDALIRGITPVEITVGVHSAEGSATKGKTTVALIGAAHEFGLGVPQRSFIRSWFDGNLARNEKIVEKALADIASGKRTTAVAARRAGSIMAADCQSRISAGGITPPLAPATIARRKRQKKSSTPLVDTGQLKASIRAYVDGARL